MTYSILVVDDVPEEAAEIGKLVSAILDCRIEYASDRYEGWSKLEKGQFNAIVLDLNLGGLHEGRLFLEMLRSRINSPPGTIIVSHLGNEPATRELKGKFNFIFEVVSKSDLLVLSDVVRRALEDAVGSREVGSLLPGSVESQEDKRSELARRVVIVAALIGAAGAIIAAVIRLMGGWLR